MPVFDDMRNYLAILGILPVPERVLPKNLQPYRSTIAWAQTIIIATCLMCYCCSMWWFVYFKAQTVGDYSVGILFCTISAVRLVLYLTMILKKSELPMVMDDLEKIIEASEFYLFLFIATSFSP